MRKRWEPAGSAAGSHLASEVGGRPPGIQEPDRVLARYDLGVAHARTHAQAGAQARSRSLSRLLASARVRPCIRLRVQARARIHSCVCSRVRVRPGRTPGSDQARHPGQQRSLGSERGLATPSPDGKGEIPLGPSVKIMPVDSYSTLGRSCEPAFKWIRQAQPRAQPWPAPSRSPRPQSRARAARRCQALAGGWSALGGHEASCSFTWPGSSPEVQPARSRA